jgi:hypothetical protein
MLRYAAHVADDADPANAWALLARPDRWHEWAPHLRGAWGLGDPEVEPGRSGFVRLAGVVPIPVAITAKDPGRSWTWRVARMVTMEHAVRARPGGSSVEITISAAGPLEATLRASYGPLVQLLLERLSRSAGARPRPTGTGTPAG